MLHGTTAEGPGPRTAIWLQGCSIRCIGCINPHLFARAGGVLTDIRRIIDDAEAVGVEGLTLLGGEPLDQAAACSHLAAEAQARGLGVICFTGFTLEDARSVAGAEDLFTHVDLLVDGPFMADRPDHERSLVGSTNQRFIHFSDRYRSFDPLSGPERLDVRISPSGEMSLAGFLTSKQLNGLSVGIAHRVHRNHA